MENHTPSQYEQWSSGWKPSMQTPISHGLTTAHPLLKCLSSGAVDTGPMSPPLIHWPTGQRMEHVDANAYLPGSFERLSVGQPPWPTGHRCNPVCVSSRSATHFRCPDLSAVDRPSLPSDLLLGRHAPDNLGQPRTTPAEQSLLTTPWGGGGPRACEMAGRVVLARNPRGKPTKPSPPTPPFLVAVRGAGTWGGPTNDDPASNPRDTPNR